MTEPIDKGMIITNMSSAKEMLDEIDRLKNKLSETEKFRDYWQHERSKPLERDLKILQSKLEKVTKIASELVEVDCSSRFAREKQKELKEIL